MPRTKYTTEEVAAFFSRQGCELLNEYVGTFAPLQYRCSCGNTSITTWNNFSKGKRCGLCVKYGHKKKRSLDEVKKTFVERGCEFLDNEFKGIHHKHRYLCKCDRECEITFAAFHYQKQYCNECGLEKMRGPGNPAWRPDREKKRRDDLFRKKSYAMLRRTLNAVGKDKVGGTSDMLGYGPKELQEHIESHPDWPKVKDDKWHIDHIWPVKAFLDHGILDVAIVNCLTNLRPTFQRDNNRKWAHYDVEAFQKWLVDLDCRQKVTDSSCALPTV